MAENNPFFYKGQIAVRGQGHKTCVHHHRKTLEWFCETCHDVICVNCISSIHKGHDIVMLSEITPKNKRQITTFINETEQKKLIQIEQEISATKDNLDKHLSHFKSVAEEVKIQGIKIKEDIDILIAKTLSQLEQLENENTQLLTSYITELEKKLGELKDQLNQCKETFQTGTDIQVFDITSRLFTDITLPKRPLLGSSVFTPNRKPYEHLDSAFGKMSLTVYGRTVSPKLENSARSMDEQFMHVQVSDEKLPSHLPKISVLSEWDSPCDISSICPDSNDGVWTCELYEKNITHLTSEGKEEQQIACPVRVAHICISPYTYHVWACSHDDNSVMELKSCSLLPSAPLGHKFNTKDKPMCLCATKDNHLLVGTNHGITKYTPTGQRVLMKTTKQVFSPCKISECPISENVAVLDEDRLIDGGENEPAIVVMNKYLQELYKYGPHQHTIRTGSESFYPKDITYDNLGHLVVADYGSNALHLLRRDGQRVQLLYTDIDTPVALCVDRQGVLWVGFGNLVRADKVKRLQYTSY